MHGAFLSSGRSYGRKMEIMLAIELTGRFSSPIQKVVLWASVLLMCFLLEPPARPIQRQRRSKRGTIMSRRQMPSCSNE